MTVCNDVDCPNEAIKTTGKKNDTVFLWATRQMPHALELVEAAFVKRLLDCWLHLIGRSRSRETTGEACGDLWQVQDLETAVVGLRRREAAHLERQRSLHHRGSECGKTFC